MRIASLSQAAFAGMMIALGILGLIKGDFTPVWEPVPKTVPAREVLVYVCALVSLAAGIGLFWKRTTAPAARALFTLLLLWFLLLRVPFLFLAPKAQDSWSGCAETAVMVAGAWVLYVGYASNWDRRRLGFVVGATSLRVARVLYGLAVIIFGEAHFAYAKETASLVPGWLPSHLAFAYLTGGTFVAAGVAVLIGVCARLAAALSAIQLGLFSLLVWTPIVVAGTKDAYQWSETVLSFALTGAAWLVADSYRRVRSDT